MDALPVDAAADQLALRFFTGRLPPRILDCDKEGNLRPKADVQKERVAIFREEVSSNFG